MRQKVYLRADADTEVGFGHFIRTLALADMLKDDFDCFYYTASPNDWQKSEVNKVCRLIELPSDGRKFGAFLDVLKGDEIVFLDNYFFTSEYQFEIKKKGCRLVCIGANDRHYYSDVLINLVLMDERKFDVEPYTHLCLGMDWILLRRPFWNVTPNFRSIDYPQKIIISYGGTDQFGLTERTIDILRDMGNYQVSVLTTETFGRKRLDSLSDRGVTVLLSLTADQIVHAFLENDLAILSASTITQEAMACGIPVFAGFYVDNQKLFYKELVRKKMITPLGNLLDKKMGDKLSRVLLEFRYTSNRVFVNRNIKQRYIHLFNRLSHDR